MARLFVRPLRVPGGWAVYGAGLTVRHQLRVYPTRRKALETVRQYWCVTGGHPAAEHDRGRFTVRW